MQNLLRLSVTLAVALGGTALTTAAMADPVTINALFMSQAAYSEQNVRDMTAGFEKANPDIKVNLEFVPYEWLHDKTVLAQGGSGYDVVLYDVIWPAEYAQNNVLQDVTARRENERELNEKQVFIQKITDITPSIIIAYNIISNEFLFVNQSLEKQLGYQPQELENKDLHFFLALIHPEDLPALKEKYGRIMEAYAQSKELPPDEEIVEFKYRILHKNGKYRWFHTYATVFNRTSKHLIEAFVTVSVDITDEVNAIVELIRKNEDLRKSEERYYGMVNEVEDYAIILLNKDGIIENWNRGAEKIKGYTAEEVIGKHIRIFYTDEDLARNLVVPHELGMTTVLVVPDGSREVVREDWELEGRDDPYVDHVTDDLTGFLQRLVT